MTAGGFDGLVCVVTGGTQGVGEAVAVQMAHAGAAGIVVCGRSPGRGRVVAETVEATGSPCLFVEADLAQLEDAFAVVDAAADRFGRLDVLCNVAGLTDRGTIEDTTPELWDQLMAVNARAPFFLTQRAVPHMRRGGGGSIVNVISIAAHGGAPHISPYVASKSALVGLTKNLANALRHDRIRVNGLNMGWTATPGEEATQRRFHGMGDDWREAIGRDRPFGRLLDPAEVARAVVFLAGPESGIISGAVWDYEQAAIGAAD